MQKKNKTKAVVISGSASLSEEMKKWFFYWQKKGYRVIDWPVPIKAREFGKKWPVIYKKFYNSLKKTDIHFVANEDKNGIKGYVGAGVFAEISFSVGLNLIRKTPIKILLYKMPSKKLFYYKDLSLWIKMGWLKVYCKQDES